MINSNQNPEDSNVNPEERRENLQKNKENQRIEENALNKSATQGEKINHQQQQKQEKHQPRDKA
ncbi:MAG: hypothetical protein Q4G27_03440 [Flavobacteriaceae bacterium]|nr:hypothetical protein [Flavobacteriaceae bacterium]